jgi:tetratricopeptide (TPR) repeat protein
MSLLELVMIVKNSGDVLKKCISSIKPYIDNWTILDTGSSDNTKDIIKEELKDIEGNLYEEDFVDFSTTRNRVFELSSKKCKYMIVLDDSYELKGGSNLRSFLQNEESSSFCIKIGNLNGNILEDYYYSLRIIKSNSNLKYTGKIHEYIYDKDVKYIKNSNIYINDIEDDNHKVRSRNRFKKDIELLLEDYKNDPTNPRTLMYLAKTNMLLKDHKTALDYLIEMQNISQNREYEFFAFYEAACLEFAEIDYNAELFKRRLLSIQKRFPERAESFYKLSVFLYESGHYEKVAKIMEKLITFKKPELYFTILESNIYDYYIPYLYIDCNIRTKKFEKALPKLDEMLRNYPYDQPLLNIKYALSDKSQFQIQALSNKKTLVIHTGSISWIWDPRKNTKISGSEYMAINMAKEFTKMGYRTFIFGSFEDDEHDYQGIYDNIQYIDYKWFTEFATKYVIDYLIVSRFVSNLVYYNNIVNVYLWVHDILPHMSKNSPILQTHLEKFRGFIVLSEWQKETIHKKIGIPKDNLLLSRNAIYSERFINYDSSKKIPFRFIYTSDPYRGLSYLIKMIQIVKEKFPQTTLSIFTRVEQIESSLLNEIKSLDYVTLSPRISQQELSKELMISDVWLYPTDFQETYCISALEAMAAGCLVATVKYAGLADTVSNRGILCDHPIYDDKNMNQLLKKLFFVLERPELKHNITNMARDWALKQNYQNLTKEWVKFFN